MAKGPGFVPMSMADALGYGSKITVSPILLGGTEVLWLPDNGLQPDWFTTGLTGLQPDNGLQPDWFTTA